MANDDRPLSLGVDIGGTFTDLVLIDAATGRLASAKVLTTPDDPARGVLEGLAKLLELSAERFDQVRTIVHGTTLATNAIIERKGARTALLTTRGFRDVLETGKELRYDLYDIFIEFPKPLVPRRLRLVVGERTRYDGEVLEPVDEAEVEQAARLLVEQGVEALAICFLHSYANPANEQRAAAAVERVAPELPISLSSAVLPEIGEYGRVSTTAANAYVQPVVRRYLGRLEQALGERGFDGAFFIMASSGGSLSLQAARDFPVRLVESGPAAGASIAAFYAEQTGVPNLLGLDMGGTTAKISLIKGGQPARTMDFEVARVRRFQRGSGLVLKTPSIDLIEIGAGGGSIAQIDPLGLLAVGPESAGAAPGPACYGLGGAHPTVTDADLALGYYNPDYFLGGEMRLDSAAATAAIERELGGPLGLPPVEAARSVFEVVNANMANAVQVYAAEKGVDVRDYTLFAFGGAAPAHAWDVARKLRVPRVLVPSQAGVLSALGCVLSPISFDFAVGYMRQLQLVDWERVNQALAGMERQGRALLEQAGVTEGVSVTRSADMRYRGQRYEVTFSLPKGDLSADDLPTLSETFYAAYREQYGREIREVPIEAVTWRVTVAGPRPEVNLAGATAGASATRPEPKASRAVYFAPAGFVECAVYDRQVLSPGARFAGPAIVEDRESTAVVPPEARASIDERGTLVIEL